MSTYTYHVMPSRFGAAPLTRDNHTLDNRIFPTKGRREGHSIAGRKIRMVQSDLDSEDPAAIINRIGFGSCNNQNKGPQQELWSHLQTRLFDLWIWSGDVVYTKGGNLDALRLAYDQLRQNGSYHSFARSVQRVVGTWDDHDLGVNDGGANTPNLEERKQLFLDFLGVPKDSSRRTRQGVYSAHEFGRDDRRVRIILLDTRFGRSDYALASIGSVGEGTLFGKLFPKIAAASRSFFGLTGLTHEFNQRGISNKRMLSEEQWEWLERQFATSSAPVNVLVSSVQVLTRNPSVESWAHFPGERRRLLKLIQKMKPKGFLILSGDVHIAIASVPKADFPVFELTSSGLTHTCTAGSVPKFICALVWNLFEHADRRQNMILSRNFGQIDIDWNKKEFVGTLNSLTENITLSYVRNFEQLPYFDVDSVPDITLGRVPTIAALSALILLAVAMKLLQRLLNRRR